MSNDSSIIAIASLELESVNGGMIPIPPGGTGMEIPGGGSLSCPAGTTPDHSRFKGNINGDFNDGILKFHVSGGVDYQHDHCVPLPKKK